MLHPCGLCIQCLLLVVCTILRSGSLVKAETGESLRICRLMRCCGTLCELLVPLCRYMGVGLSAAGVNLNRLPGMPLRMLVCCHLYVVVSCVLSHTTRHTPCFDVL